MEKKRLSAILPIQKFTILEANMQGRAIAAIQYKLNLTKIMEELGFVPGAASMSSIVRQHHLDRLTSAHRSRLKVDWI